MLKNSGNTLKSLEGKFKTAVDYILKKYKNKIVSNLVIIVGILNKNEKTDLFMYETINESQTEIKKTNY
ncbi:MAG: hypothetical protein ACOX7E_07850 [Paludibacter sp.]|jgi:hypothetical protein